MDDRPIGVLDSGVGGLTVWREILSILPNESTVYIGDSLNAPYGKRSPENIRELAGKLISFLLSKKAKLIVIACNTITVNGIDLLRKEFPQVPIVGTVPVVKLAAATTKNRKIGILVTKATAKSPYNQALIEKFAPDMEVITVGTNALVPLIEAHESKELPKVIAQELAPFVAKGVDTVVLGSTHFPILRPFIQDFLGPKVTVLDSGGAVARQVGRILANNDAQKVKKHASHRLFTTGDVEPFESIVFHLTNSTHKATRAVLQ